LQAALKVFVEMGFGAARLEDIATAAGVSKGTIYLYFASKEDVFEALIRETLKPNFAAMSQAIKTFDGPSSALLRQVLTIAGEFLSKPPLIYFPRLIIGEGGRFPRLAEFYHREVISFGMGLLSQIFERGEAEAEFRSVASIDAARLAMAPVLFMAIYKSLFERFDAHPLDAKSFIEAHLDIFVCGLAPGAGAQEGDAR
jgi:AcrR family transcriptional regulator